MTDEEKKKIQIHKEEEQRQPEVTPESLAEREEMLLFQKEAADEIAAKSKALKESRKEEIVELNGQLITFRELILNAPRLDIDPIFPNSNEYFREMFRLAGWRDWNPNQYIKPFDAKVYLVETIYYRFHKEILPALKAKAIPGKHKLYHLLKDDGISKMYKFRDDAVEMMKTFDDGQIYEFRKAYAEKYKTAMQLKLL